ncbi:uncharacterized protein LOC114523825 [Dendronephthya gigantea]|uniref:uncharacterized protein LOC114523825 n=1 Tax=Dendronephthya gigantea TaxID=151771 RepID=UPI0010695D06|nr:uncharacterized protein LOC114523825 [Dendronephthya gigantea]
MAEKRFSIEELNFFKFASIVYDEFPKMLRSIFVRLWNTKIAPLSGYLEWDDTPLVRNLLLAREGGSTDIPINKSFEEWDCTALFKATIYSKSFNTTTTTTTIKRPTIKTLSDQFIKGKSPTSFHLSLTSATGNQDETITLAIDQVRLLRNTLCHMPKSTMAKADFDNYVQLAKDAFAAVGFPTYKIDEIGELKEEDFPTMKVDELNKKIRDDLQEINKFLQDMIKKQEDNKLFQKKAMQKLDMIIGKIDDFWSSVEMSREGGKVVISTDSDEVEGNKNEVFNDFQSGRLKKRSLEEPSRNGVEVKGMKIETVNMENVNTTMEAINKRNTARTWNAIKEGNLEELRSLVESGVDVNRKVTQELSWLHLAAQFGSLDIVKYLVEHGGKVTSEDNSFRETVLHSACRGGNDAIVQYLLQHGAAKDINKKNPPGLTPLNIACSEDHTTVAQTLAKALNGDDKIILMQELTEPFEEYHNRESRIEKTASEIQDLQDENVKMTTAMLRLQDENVDLMPRIQRSEREDANEDDIMSLPEKDMSAYQHISEDYNPQDMSEYQHPSRRYINTSTTPEDSRSNPQDMSEYQHPSRRYNTFTTPEDSSSNPQKYEHRSATTRIRRRHQKRISGKTPKKNVEDIQDISEMLGLFRLLHIAHDPTKLDLSEMKKTAKRVLEDQGSGSEKYSYGTTGFGVIAMTKDEDMLKRKTLLDFNLQVDDCVRQLGSHAIEVLDVYYSGGSVLNVLGEERERLTKTEYNILIAGDNSAGKSSLVNLILGEELLPHYSLHTTFTICEVKYGKERKLIVHHNYDEEQMTPPLPEIYLLKTKEECGKNYCEQIAPFVRRKSNEGSKYTKVEIFWPHELLEEEIVIVDSPGLGECDEMDEVLMNYLPNAFAFICVLDASSAGGVQKYIKEKLRNILKKVKSSDGGFETLQHLAECWLFICNKWDQVKENERSETKKYVVAKLRECWEDSNLNYQMEYMSITDAIEVQEYGGVTEEFNDLLKKIKTMVLRAINIRLYNHWQSLYELLYQIYRVTYFFNQEVQSTHQETHKRMEEIEKRIKEIERKEQDVKREMEERVKTHTKVLQAKLEGYINSMDFKTKFCSWTNCALPKGEITWEMTKRNIKEAIDSRFKELLIEWENGHQVYAEIHREILDEFRKSLNLLEEELEGVDKAIYSVERRAYHSGNKNKIPLKAKVIFGVISPLLIPFGVAGLVIGMPVLGALGIKGKVDKKKKIHNINNPLEQLRKRSEKFLEELPKDYVLQYAQRLMENTRMVLSRYGDQISTLIEADRKLVTQLFNDRRTQGEILGMYDPIQKKSLEIIYKILPWGIKLCPATINASDLDWKKDHSSCLGEGEVSRVYAGKLKNLGKNKSQTSEMNVAVKVFKKQFDEPNSRYFLQEELQIRYVSCFAEPTNVIMIEKILLS